MQEGLGFRVLSLGFRSFQLNAVSVFRKVFIDCDCNTRAIAIRADVLGLLVPFLLGGLRVSVSRLRDLG